jgi:hypothetical protein
MKSPQLTFIASLLACASAISCLGQKAAPQFKYEQFPATVYHGKPRIPRGLHKTVDGEWSNDDGPVAFSPRVNFAGEYNLAAHTCGTCCRFYGMTNLRTGHQVSQVSMFDDRERLTDDGEQIEALTKDGDTFVSVLYFRPNSNLLIVQYQLDLCSSKRNMCRQRYFVFENGSIRPISKTFWFCTKEGEEPE